MQGPHCKPCSVGGNLTQFHGRNYNEALEALASSLLSNLHCQQAVIAREEHAEYGWLKALCLLFPEFT